MTMELALLIARVLFAAADSSIDIEFQTSAIKTLAGDRLGTQQHDQGEADYSVSARMLGTSADI